MGVEQEIKLRAPNTQTLETILQDEAIGALRCSPVEEIRMDTTYYDTEDHLLDSRKWVLRGRAENDEMVITLKTPADGNHIRGEWELRGANLIDRNVIAPHAFQALFTQGAPKLVLSLGGKRLETVCGVQFIRRRFRVQLDEQTQAELALDIGTLHRGGRTGPLIEVELELLCGNFTKVEELARQLEQRFGLKEEPLSKFQQTMIL